MGRANTLIFSFFLISILCTGTYLHWTNQNSQFNSLIGQYPHFLGGIFTGNSTYYEYYQVNASGKERYYLVVRAENSKVLKIREISYSDYLVYTGRALDMARSYVAGIVTVDLSSGNVTLKEVPFDELPKWVQGAVKVLGGK
ncbi:hypothetical protein [Thermococcus sp.]|uniref:hypothetical protein n=1 Tax=Thermococcus sp. TaxID=35749 RepID=UPI00262DB096|nr:hypothetical protein [Thermococcus sp.]